MRKHTFLILALSLSVVLGVIGIASAEKPVVVEAGNLKWTFNAGLTPKSLQKDVFKPAALVFAGKVQTADASQPPPMSELVLKLDRNVAIDTSGYPTCTVDRLRHRDTLAVERDCGSAVAGEGNVTVSGVSSGPIPAVSKGIVFNGGIQGRTTTLYVHSDQFGLAPGALVIPIRITEVDDGRFGTKAVATIPPIANGTGWVTSFDLTINKNLKLKGKPFSMLDAKCPDGHLNVRGNAIFEDGTRAGAEVTRPCTGLER